MDMVLEQIRAANPVQARQADYEERRTRNAESRCRSSGVVTTYPHVTCRRHQQLFT